MPTMIPPLYLDRCTPLALHTARPRQPAVPPPMKFIELSKGFSGQLGVAHRVIDPIYDGCVEVGWNGTVFGKPRVKYLSPAEHNTQP
jgi:hypothetical protein